MRHGQEISLHIPGLTGLHNNSRAKEKTVKYADCVMVLNV